MAEEPPATRDMRARGMNRGPLPRLPGPDVPFAFDPPELSFAGIPQTFTTPPDPVGDIGSNHYIQMVNSGSSLGMSFSAIVRIHDRTGNSLAPDFILHDLWRANGPASSPCTTGNGDPIVLYDAQADRWLLSEYVGPVEGDGHLCVYISRTPDPVAGGWYYYDFATPNVPDYPKYAVWPDAYYVTTRESTPTNPAPAHALDRESMLLGLDPVRPRQRHEAPGIDVNDIGRSLTPADIDGWRPPPAGSPAFLMRHRDDELRGPVPPDPTSDQLEVWE
jgi:hypothetical protein